MATTSYPIQKINYLSKDFITLHDEMIQRLPVITKGKWSNLNESDPGIAMLEVFMSMVDNLLFYQDQMAQEVYLPNARQRNNVIKLLRLLGYEFKSASASTGTVTVTTQVGSSPIFPVTIEAGAQFSAQSPTTNNTVIFTSTQKVMLLNSSDSKTIPVIQGVNTTETFSSDGTPSQKFTMSNTSIDKTTVVVSVSTSPFDNTQTVDWTVVESFYDSAFSDKHFKIQIDEFSRVSIIFGDGQFGMIPPVDCNIIVTYVVTNGSEGNVGQGAITGVVSSLPYIIDEADNSVSLSITESTASSGGGDVETIEHAKATALGLLFGLRRALSRQDYASLITSIPGVDKAIAWGENEEANPDYRLFNKVRVSFLSAALTDMYYNPASRSSYRSLRDGPVKSLLLERMPITTRLAFIDPEFVDVFLTLTLGINTTATDPNIVIDSVKTNLLNFYDFDNIGFGQDVRISDIMGVVNRTSGVSWAVLNRLGRTPATETPDTSPNPPTDIVLNRWEFPTLQDTNNLPSTTANTVVSTPYLRVLIPTSTNIGINDIIVINPDEQSSALVNGFLYFPSPLDKHITINYVTTVDQPYPNGGYYGNPIPESDSPIWTSNQ